MLFTSKPANQCMWKALHLQGMWYILILFTGLLPSVSCTFCQWGLAFKPQAALLLSLSGIIEIIMISFLYCDKLSTCEISLLKHLNLFWFFFFFCLFIFFWFWMWLYVCLFLFGLFAEFFCLFILFFFFLKQRRETWERGLTSKVLRFDC